MAMRTYYGVQPFENAPHGRSKVLGVVPASTSGEAIRRAERLAQERGGAIAFSRAGDDDFAVAANGKCTRSKPERNNAASAKSAIRHPRSGETGKL